MKLLTYEYKMIGPRAGVMVGDRIADLTGLLGSSETIRDVRALMELYPDAVERTKKALGDGSGIETIALGDVSLLAPVLQPPTIRDSCIFETHSKSAGEHDGKAFDPPAIWYKRPYFYYQSTSVVCGPEASVKRKTGSVTLDYESEVAMVIGRRGRDVKEGEALNYILGLTIFNDWSDRATCAEEVGFLGMHKSKDFASGLGPVVVTMDEVMDKYHGGKLDLKVKVWVNGKLTTDSSTADMHWTLSQLFALAAQDTVILPGDIIGFGTVGGGCIYEHGHDTPYLQDGDTVEIEIEKIGRLRQYVAKN